MSRRNRMRKSLNNLRRLFSCCFPCQRKRRADADSESAYCVVEAAADSLSGRSNVVKEEHLTAAYPPPTNCISKGQTQNNVVVVLTPTSVSTGTEVQWPILMPLAVPIDEMFRMWQQHDLVSSQPQNHVILPRSILRMYGRLHCPRPCTRQLYLDSSPCLVSIVDRFLSSTVSSETRAFPYSKVLYILMREAWRYFAIINDYLRRQGGEIRILNVHINATQVIVVYRIIPLSSRKVADVANKQSISWQTRLCILGEHFESTYCDSPTLAICRHESNCERISNSLTSSEPPSRIPHISDAIDDSDALWEEVLRACADDEEDSNIMGHLNQAVMPLSDCVEQVWLEIDLNSPREGESIYCHTPTTSESDALWEEVLRACADEEEDSQLNATDQPNYATSLSDCGEDEWVEINLNSPRDGESESTTVQCAPSPSFNLKNAASKVLQPLGDVLSLLRRKSSGQS